MVDHSDLPGPGEQVDPNVKSGEAPGDPIPDGDMPRVQTARDACRQTQDLIPVALPAFDAARDGTDGARKRRTGTDRDAYAVIPPSTHATERQRDHSPGDQRETVFDPAQDNPGPQSDKG